MSETNDQRQEHRLLFEDIIFIEVASADIDNNAPAAIVICNTLDVSANGLQVSMDRPLTVGGIHQIGVQLREPERRLYLTGQVKWCRTDEHVEGYMLGIALFESEETDIQAWKELIVERFS